MAQRNPQRPLLGDWVNEQVWKDALVCLSSLFAALFINPVIL
jgi:hypothetical protein